LASLDQVEGLPGLSSKVITTEWALGNSVVATSVMLFFVAAIAVVAATAAMTTTGFSSPALANPLFVICRVSGHHWFRVSIGPRSDIAGHIDHNKVVSQTGLCCDREDHRLLS
jgi:hypothetical protein